MANLSVTASQVVPTTDRSKIKLGKAGEAIAVGQFVYKKAADGKIYLAQCDDTAAAAECLGIATSGASAANQDVAYQKGGTLTLGAGAAPVQGTPYFLSATAGSVCPDADIVSTNYLTFIGIGGATNTLVMPDKGPAASGVTHA